MTAKLLKTLSHNFENIRFKILRLTHGSSRTQVEKISVPKFLTNVYFTTLT